MALPSGQYRRHIPHLPPPKFSGKYSELENFISLFETLAHNDHSIMSLL